MFRRLIGFAMAAATVAAVACSGSGGDGESASATEIPATADGDGVQIAPGLQGESGGASPAAAPAGRTVDEKEGGTLKLLWSDPPTLDPALVSDVTSARIVVEIFSGLVRLDSNLQIVPDLAESWEITGGGTVYTFKLRSDARFSDGTPVAAGDFKWAMERAANPDTESTVAELYLSDIVGIQEIIDGDATTASGIEVLGDRTLRLTVDGPKAYFLAKLTYPTAFALLRQNVEQGGENWTDEPVGTGPFTLGQYRIGERIVLKRNENYHGRPAYLDEVELNLAGGVAMAMYEADEIDVTGVGLADLDRVQDPREPLNRDLVRVPPGFSISYIGFNVEEPPFDDRAFRQALAHAVDKKTIAEEVFASLVTPASGILPPRFPAFNDKLIGLQFDPDLARQRLAESSYSTLSDRDKRIVITSPGTGGSPGLTLEVVADQWKQILDIDVEIQQVEWATYLQDVHRNRLQAFSQGWEADYPDPEDFLDILFHSESRANNGKYSNPEVDRLVELARTEQDVVRRTELYQQAEQIIVDDVAWLPLWWDTEGMALVKPWVRDYKFMPMVVATFKDVWISK